MVADLRARMSRGLSRLSLPTLAERFDGRANSIGAIRLALALAVLLAHCWPLALGRPMLGSAETMKQADVGKLAVYGFFLLSGLLITGSALRFRAPRSLSPPAPRPPPPPRPLGVPAGDRVRAGAGHRLVRAAVVRRLLERPARTVAVRPGQLALRHGPVDDLRRPVPCPVRPRPGR